MKKDFRSYPRERLTKFLETVEKKWEKKKTKKEKKVLTNNKK